MNKSKLKEFSFSILIVKLLKFRALANVAVRSGTHVMDGFKQMSYNIYLSSSVMPSPKFTKIVFCHALVKKI